MKRIALAILLVLVACKKEEDPSTSNTSTSTSASAITITTSSVTPLAPIDPIATASASNAALRDAGPAIDDTRRAALAKQAEEMQLQMLRALASSSPPQGVLQRSDIPPIDLSEMAAARDAGLGVGGGGLRMGGGGGTVMPGRGGGLAEIGTRDH